METTQAIPATDALAEVRRRLGAALSIAAPPPKLTVSEWADRFRVLPKESSAEPGRWSTDRAPYQRGMLDAVNDPGVEEIVFYTASQIGKTEIVNNVVGYFVDQDPSPILVVLPTVELAEAWSKDRLAPTIADTPVLRAKVKDARSRDSGNTITRKKFPGGQLTIVGANAPASLSSRPIRIVLCDEVDRFPASAGTEGDPVSLAARRTATFWNRKRLLTSTPTIRGLSRIEAAWEDSDQRRYFVPCPECGEMQVLKWNPADGRGGIVYQKTERGDAIPETARYRCSSCSTEIDESSKRRMLSLGEWRATYPERKVRGFHISALYSPWVRWAEIVADWEVSHKNPERLKVFVNTILGESWEEEGDAIEADSLRARVESYEAPVPDGVGLLVAAVDVQADRLEAVVKGYGAGQESWLIEHAIIPGDPGTEKVWVDLDRLLVTRYRNAAGRPFSISCSVVDSGGQHTEQVYRYTTPRLSRRVFAIKGASGPREIVGRPTKTERYRSRLYIVGVDTAKDSLWSRLKIRAPGPGYLHLPASVDDEYLEQLVSERPVRRWKKGKGWAREWVKVRDRNEAWDLEVYALAALYILGTPTINSLESLANEARNPEEAKQIEQGPRRPRAPGRGSAWVSGWRR